MPDHPHVLVRTLLGQKNFSAFWRDVNSCFVIWFNKKMGRRGNLIMERISSSAVEDAEAVLAAMRYADLNPVRAKIATSPQKHQFSSYAHYAFGTENALIDDAPEYLALGATPEARQKRYRASFSQHIETHGQESYVKQPIRKKCTRAPILIVDQEWLFELIEENRGAAIEMPLRGVPSQEVFANTG